MINKIFLCNEGIFSILNVMDELKRWKQGETHTLDFNLNVFNIYLLVTCFNCQEQK